MQKQQYNSKTIFFEEHLNDDCLDTIVNVDRYKVISDIKLMDGFVIQSNYEVRKVIDSEVQNNCLNVIYESDIDVKRMLWIKTDNLELISSVKESISKSDYKAELKDKNENWFD